MGGWPPQQLQREASSSDAIRVDRDDRALCNQLGNRIKDPDDEVDDLLGVHDLHAEPDNCGSCLATLGEQLVEVAVMADEHGSSSRRFRKDHFVSGPAQTRFNHMFRDPTSLAQEASCLVVDALVQEQRDYEADLSGITTPSRLAAA